MATCLVIGASPRQRACIVEYVRLERGSGVHHIPLWYESWREFCADLPAMPNAFGIVTDGVHGLSGSPALAALLIEHPNVDVFYYGAPHHLAGTPKGNGRLEFILERASGVIQEDVTGPSALRAALLRGYGARYTRAFLADLRLQCPASGAMAERLIRETARGAYSVQDWACEDGVTVRTIERQVIRTTMSSPRMLLRLAALYNVARQQLYGTRRAIELAEAVGFGGSSSLAQCVRRHLLVQTRKLEGLPGLELAADRLRKALRPPSRGP